MINHDTLHQLPSIQRSYRSSNTVTDINLIANLPKGFLHPQDPPNLPPHESILKVECPLILLRTLNAPNLCKGTRMVVKQIMNLMFEVEIITCFELKDNAFIYPFILFPMKKRQFPLKLSFAMTLNKTQGQWLQVVTIDLRMQRFSHDQFCLDCSRGDNLNILFMFLTEKSKMLSTNLPFNKLTDIDCCHPIPYLCPSTIFPGFAYSIAIFPLNEISITFYLHNNFTCFKHWRHILT